MSPEEVIGRSGAEDATKRAEKTFMLWERLVSEVESLRRGAV